MIPEIKELEPQLKEILYRCMEDVQATKAALYLSAFGDLNARQYELVTSYQYQAPNRRAVNATDDLVDRLLVRRDSVVVNGLAADPRFSEMLFTQGTDRMLAVPLFTRGRMAGFIDMRDKASRKPFEAPDVDAAKKIAEDLLSFLGSKGLYGIGPIAISDEPTPMPQIAAPQIASPSIGMRTSASQAAPATSIPQNGHPLSPAALAVVEAARQQFARRQVSQFLGRPTLSENDLEVVRTVLPAALAIPGAVFAAFTAVGHPNNPQLIVTLAPLADVTKEALQSHLQGFIKRLGFPWMNLRTQVAMPFGARETHVAADAIASVLSAPVNPQTIDGVVLTVAFEQAPDPSAQRTLQIFLREIESAVDSAVNANQGRSDRVAIAEKLVEPDFQKYPALADHSKQVAAIAQRFARLLELPVSQVETIRVAALVHDVGLRFLDYERLYRKPALNADELRALQDHSIIGAAIVEPVLGTEVANAVLRHHERVDGKGYPSKLTGDKIPLAARVIQICDAWMAMVDEQSYQPPISRPEALARLRNAAGSQFDAALTAKFIESIKVIVG